MKSEDKVFRMKREQLVTYMKSSGAVTTKKVADAFLSVKRELFVKPGTEGDAYFDGAMPIGFGQTISQPSTIAIMLEMLSVPEGAKVLEVGGGCGYVCALLSELVGEQGKVFGIELVRELKKIAEKNLEKQGCKNVTITLGDGSLGLAKEAPFDRILVSAACPYVPKPLFDQLNEDGIIIAPVGDGYTQIMTRVRKKKAQMLKDIYEGTMFAFVPLKGEFGFK